jgi:hypothetical protein
MEEHMNVNQKKITVRDLLGINQAGIIWGRLAAFFFAFLISSLFINIVEMLIRSYSPAYDSWLVYIGLMIMTSFLFTACTAAVFYFIRGVYPAIIVSAIGYGIIITVIRYLLSSQPQAIFGIIFSLSWVFLVLIGLHLSGQWIKKTWLGLMTAYVFASVTQKIMIIIIYAIKEPEIIFSFKSELFSLVFIAMEAVTFGGLFWAGLQLRWSRWESAAVPAAVPGAVMPGAWKSHELSELKKAVDTRMIQKMLRPAAIGSILFGIIAIVMGVQGAEDHSLNIVLALIGALLFFEGIWCAAAPKPVGLVVDGIALIILGVWNILVTISNISAGAEGMSGFFVLGVWQIIWGVQSIKRYKHYSYLTGVTISPESLQGLNNMAANIKETSVSGDENMMEFQIKSLFKKTSLKGKLIEGMILLVGPKGEFFMDEIAKIEIKPTKTRSTADLIKASLNICDQTFLGEISQESMDRYHRWKSSS